jgi:hypothetical protein
MACLSARIPALRTGPRPICVQRNSAVIGKCGHQDERTVPLLGQNSRSRTFRRLRTKLDDGLLRSVPEPAISKAGVCRGAATSSDRIAS